MNELEQKLTSLGLSQEQAKQAIQAVVGFIKAKLPADFQGMVDQAMAGQMPDLGALGNIAGSIKGFFGDKDA